MAAGRGGHRRAPPALEPPGWRISVRSRCGDRPLHDRRTLFSGLPTVRLRQRVVCGARSHVALRGSGRNRRRAGTRFRGRPAALTVRGAPPPDSALEESPLELDAAAVEAALAPF